MVANRKRFAQIALWIILSLGATTMLLPFWWMLSTSFDQDAILDVPFPPRFIPGRFTIDTYKMTFTNVPMFKYIFNSLIIAAGVIAISILSALTAGYALSKIRFKGHRQILILALSTMMVPFEVTMIPQFFLFNKLGLINNYLAFYLPAVNYVFGTFFVKQYMDTIPDSLREAALIDGANDFYISFKIYFPLCGPMISTLLILLFLGSWNDFLWPLIVLTDANLYTIQVGVAMFTYNQGVNTMPAIRMATTMASILPVLIVYLFLQRYIVESIALTGIKQ